MGRNGQGGPGPEIAEPSRRTAPPHTWANGAVAGPSADGSASLSPSASRRVGEVSAVPVTSTAGETEVATSLPPATPAAALVGGHLLPSGQVLMDAAEYNDLVKLKSGRERVRKYRDKRRAAAKAADIARTANVTGPVRPTVLPVSSNGHADVAQFDFASFRD